MNQTKILNKVSELHSKAKDGKVEINGVTYVFTFDRYQGVYIVTDLNTNEELMKLNTRKITDARKWLREYLSN
jgi:hypothetical protein